MRISDWSSDVCSSDLLHEPERPFAGRRLLIDELDRRMLAMVDIVDQPRRTFFRQRELREDFDQRLAVIDLADDAVSDIHPLLDEAFAKRTQLLVTACPHVAVLQTSALVNPFRSRYQSP